MSDEPVEQEEIEAVPQPAVSNEAIQQAMYQLEAQQNFPMAVVAGLVAALVGAAIWAATTIVTEYQLGLMAIAVGLLVGYAVRLAGKGFDKIFGVTGAVFALIGCMAGNLISISYFIAQQENMAFLELLPLLNFTAIVDIMTSTFDGMDLLFYGIAVYEGYRFSFRQVTDADILTLAQAKA